MTKNSKKQVDKRITFRERREELVTHIRELGLWNMPSYRVLGEKYGVSHNQIAKDFKIIVSTFDSNELDKCFTEFYAADKKAMRELRRIMLQGSDDEKIKAIDTMLRLQKGITDLLEAYAKKRKIPDKIEHEIKQVVINIVKPEEEIYEIKPKENKAEKPKTKKTKGEDNGI